MLKEFKENQFFLDDIVNDFDRKYFTSKFKWYSKKANKNKVCFYVFTIMTVVAPVMSGIVMLVPIEQWKVKLISEIILGIATVSAALLPLYDFRKKWGNYRNATEMLKHSLRKYHDSDEEGKKKVIEEVERMEIDTHHRWIKPFKERK